MVENFYCIDAHCHIYPEKIASAAVGHTDEFYHVTSKHNGTIDDLLSSGKRAGVDKFIVQSVATTPKQVKRINEFIAESVKSDPESFTGLGTLHPESTDIKGDLEYLLSLGLHGVKLHPDIQGFKLDDYRCLEIYENCEKMGAPVLLHTGDLRYDNSNPNRLKPLLETYKDLTFVGAHFGGWSIWENASFQLAEYDNFYVDCSSSFYYTGKNKAKEIIRRYGAEKVMFATDYPMWNAETEIKTLLDMELSEDEYVKIFSENAKKVYKLK